MRRIVTILTVLMISAGVYAQKERPQNLPGKFNGKERRFHFGFTLGYNKSSFALQMQPDFSFEDSLISLQVKPSPGFNLGIVSNLHISNSLKLRFIPSLSFQDRTLIYNFLDTTSSVYSLEHRVESTFLDFPLLLKWRTNRINNFAAYVIGGGQYSIDMATQAEVVGGTPIVKIQRQDILGTVGGGMDFFMPYFKFGIELRYNFGLKDVFIPDANILSDPISKIYTRGWLLSFTFEG